MQLSRKIKVEKFFGGVNRQEKREAFLAARDAAAALVKEGVEQEKGMSE